MFQYANFLKCMVNNDGVNRMLYKKKPKKVFIVGRRSEYITIVVMMRVRARLVAVFIIAGAELLADMTVLGRFNY